MAFAESVSAIVKDVLAIDAGTIIVAALAVFGLLWVYNKYIHKDAK